ncbi:MAG TPA: hypothetical protein PLI96_11355 [Halothiobacillus sp.]|nr:hypothetical protein [Halothiobacillus sp.]
MSEPAPRPVKDLTPSEYEAAKRALIGSPVRERILNDDAATLARFKAKHEKPKD